MIRSAAAVLFLLAATSASAAVPINGRWLTDDGSAVVTVGPCGGQTCGRITTVLKAAPGAPKVDAGNPDPSLRTRSIVGLPILTSFVDKGDDWRGKIYDPRNGKTYKSIVKRNSDGTLKVQGCIAFFCQTQTWRPAR